MLTIQDLILPVEFKVVQEHTQIYIHLIKKHYIYIFFLYRKHCNSLTMSTVEREDTNNTDFEDYARGNNEELCIQPASSKNRASYIKLLLDY